VSVEQFSWLSDQGARVLIEQLQDGIFAIENEKMAYANQRLCDMLEYPADKLVGMPFINLVAPEDIEVIGARHRDRISGKHVPDHYMLHLRTAAGAVICCDLHVGMTVNRAGRTVTVGSVRDVTRQEAMQAELKATSEQLRFIYEQLPDIYYRVNMEGIITMVSPSSLSILGYRPEEMLGKTLSSYYVAPEDRQRVVKQIADGGGRATQAEAALRHKNGDTVWITANSYIRYGPDGKPAYIDGVARDTTERKRMEEQLTALARTDSLTGAYSRRYFMDRSEEIIRLMKRHQRPLSMMIADLDHFKRINDTHGHQAGDKALVAFTGMCREVIRESDVLGRLGGEEFGLVLPETPLTHAHTLAERLREATAAIEIPLDDCRIGITVSIGLVELNEDETSLGGLMRRADLAMYQAKTGGRNRVAIS
jgi:diguanylate cyclase (GGDEF)-like protein/PAS domain S-box-containing protein